MNLSTKNSSNEPCFDVEPDDPTGVIHWSDQILIARCGAMPNGRIECGYCAKAYKFRSCWVLGVRYQARTCTRCDLRRAIVRASVKAKKALCEELAGLIQGCTPAQAFHQAYACFGYLSEYRKPNLYPAENVVYPDVSDFRHETIRLPYRD